LEQRSVIKDQKYYPSEGWTKALHLDWKWQTLFLQWEWCCWTRNRYGFILQLCSL